MRSKKDKRRSPKKSLLKKFKHSPLKGTLITPLPHRQIVDLSIGVDLPIGVVDYRTLDDDVADAIRYAFCPYDYEYCKTAEGIKLKKDFLFELESGDFETTARAGKHNLLQRLWLRYQIWRMRRKIRKALRQK